MAGTYTINQGTPDLAVLNWPASGTVGGQFLPTVEADGDGATSVTSTTETICSVNTSTGYVSFVAAGTCTLTAHVAEGTNYLAADGNPYSFQIVEAPVTEFSSSCTYRIQPRSNMLQVKIAWENADPGVTMIELDNGLDVTKEITPTVTGTLGVNLKGESGNVSYRLWGGETKKSEPTPLMELTACTAEEPPVD